MTAPEVHDGPRTKIMQQLHAGAPPIEPPTRHHLGERESAGLPLLLAWPDPTRTKLSDWRRGLVLQATAQPVATLDPAFSRWVPSGEGGSLCPYRIQMVLYCLLVVRYCQYVPVVRDRVIDSGLPSWSWSWGWREGEGERNERRGLSVRVRWSAGSR